MSKYSFFSFFTARLFIFLKKKSAEFLQHFKIFISYRLVNSLFLHDFI